MNAIGNVSAKEAILFIQLRPLVVVYANRKVLGNNLLMDAFLVFDPDPNRFTHTR